MGNFYTYFSRFISFSRIKNHYGLLHLRCLRGAAQEAFSGEALHAEMQRMLEADMHRLPQGMEYAMAMCI